MFLCIWQVLFLIPFKLIEFRFFRIHMGTFGYVIFLRSKKPNFTRFIQAPVCLQLKFISLIHVCSITQHAPCPA